MSPGRANLSYVAYGRACRILLVAGGLLCAVLAPASSRAEEAIRDIQVTGNQRIATETILSQLQFTRGAPYDSATADRALKALFATGQFADVRVERRGATLVVIVIENPSIASVEIKGNSAIDKSKLESELKLKKGVVYTRAKAETDARRIRDIYRAQGRYQTTVEPAVTPLANNQVALRFDIREAEVVKIQRIAFTGNRAFSESDLRDVITSSQSSWLDILKTTIYYDKERLALDRELLLRHYHKHGFPNAKVSEASAELDTASKGFIVTFNVEEGERFTFGEMRVDSHLEQVPAAELVPLLQTVQGDTYDVSLVDKTVEKLTLALVERGERGATVTPQMKPGTGVPTMAITYVVAEGPPLTIERIDISGNVRTKDFVIRRELRIAEGEPFNRFLVERAKKRIEALGFFRTVEVKTTRGSQPDTIAIEIAVTEQETGELSFGIGFSENEGIIGDIGYTERNLFGNGQQLKLKLAGSAKRFQADVGFTEPHLFGSDIAGGFDLFYKDLDRTRESSFKSQRAGGSLRTGFAVSDSFTAGINYTLSRNRLYDVGPNASQAIKEAADGKESNTYYTSSIGYSQTFDGRDRAKNPTSGVYYSLAQDFAGFGGDVSFIRNTAEIRGYYPVTKNVTLAARASGGTITGWGGEDVRLLDLFYKGSETVRGFAPAGIGPRDAASANKDALGGKYYFATSAELRFPVPFVPEDLGLRGAVFADAGSLWGVNAAGQALPGLVGDKPALRASVGTGLIWDSPIGPLRLDYAVPLIKQSFDKTQPLSFGLVPVF